MIQIKSSPDKSRCKPHWVIPTQVVNHEETITRCVCVATSSGKVVKKTSAPNHRNHTEYGLDASERRQHQGKWQSFAWHAQCMWLHPEWHLQGRFLEHPESPRRSYACFFFFFQMSNTSIHLSMQTVIPGHLSTTYATSPKPSFTNTSREYYITIPSSKPVAVFQFP